MEEITEEEKLITLLKSYNFKFTDVNKLSKLKYKTENVISYSCDNTLEFDNGLLLSIRKWNGLYDVYIGRNGGWYLGLELDDIEITFQIPVLSFEEFKKGFENTISNQKFYLVSRYDGRIQHVHFKGNIEEIKRYGLENGYEIEEKNYDFVSLFDFVLINKDKDIYNARTLYPCVLSDTHAKAFMRKGINLV